MQTKFIPHKQTNKLGISLKTSINVKHWIVISLIGSFLYYHLITLDISPVPWFDETFFASITASYSATGKYYLTIAPYAYKGEMLLYGPIYFWITTFFTDVFGFSPYIFRLPGLIAGFLVILVLYKICRVQFTEKVSILIAGVFALDSLFNSNMHSGRMDTLALLFVLVSYLLYLKYRVHSIPHLLIFSGFAFSLALLTTPRSSVILLPLLFLQLYDISIDFRLKKVLDMVIFGSVVLLLYYIWILIAFGDIPVMLTYYSEFKNDYIGGKFNIPMQQKPLLFGVLLSLIIGMLVNYRAFLTEIVVISILSIVSFYLIVHDTGNYSTFIAPFQYIIVGAAAVLFYNKHKNSPRLNIVKVICLAPFITVLLYNTAFFTIKLTTLYISSETRNPLKITDFIKLNIPPNSRVIGGEAYYYAVSQANSDFQYINILGDDIKREYYQRNVFNYEYIVWPDQLSKYQPDLLKIYSNNSELVELAKFNNNRNKNWPLALNLLNILNVPVEKSYDCTLYKRLR